VLSHPAPVPWTNVYGLARTLVALGTAGTLAASSTATLFRPVLEIGDHPSCRGVDAAAAFCLVPDGGLTTVRWACVAVLLLAASGWLPRWTALPHAYVSFSVWTSVAIPDGGDQIAAVLSLLFVLPALGDRRRWHWGRPLPPPETGAGRAAVLAGSGALVVARLQMSVVYFQACVAKLSHAEWADGTAMYYWGNHAAFGPPGPLRPLTEPVLAHPLGTALLSWAPLFLELALSLTLLLPQRRRWWLLGAGLLFHGTIAVTMGLWSFGLAMAGGLLLLCAPLGGALERRPAPPAGGTDTPDGDAADPAPGPGDAGAPAPRPRGGALPLS
jgi:antimicrobial peptide system SdpB family protein